MKRFIAIDTARGRLKQTALDNILLLFQHLIIERKKANTNPTNQKRYEHKEITKERSQNKVKFVLGLSGWFLLWCNNFTADNNTQKDIFFGTTVVRIYLPKKSDSREI